MSRSLPGLLCAALLPILMPACSDDASDNGGAVCNNGVLEADEKCDPGIASGSGSCPTKCDAPADACKATALRGSADECTAQCVTTSVTKCEAGDGCCPDGCDVSTDGDCAIVCGDDKVEGDEKCDGNCPTQCTPGQCASSANLVGKADECNVECVDVPIEECKADGCCPDNCTSINDPDCTASVGDACETDAHCPGLCFDETNFRNPGGYCSLGCFEKDYLCRGNSHCGVANENLAFCVRSCAEDADCRQAEGYECFDTDGDEIKECAAVGNGSGPVGAPCDTTADCAGGQSAVCSSETDGYCTLRSCETSPSDTCPTGSHCVNADDDSLRPSCGKSCTTNAGCRSDGYACYDFDGDTKKECWVAGTGAAAIGATCDDSADCAGGPFGFCFRLWADGYCSKDCSPDGGKVCPTGSTCIDVEAGTLRCLKTCNGAGDCRSGHTCTALGEDETKVCIQPSG